MGKGVTLRGFPLVVAPGKPALAFVLSIALSRRSIGANGALLFDIVNNRLAAQG
jgi:hypothetical protein